MPRHPTHRRSLALALGACCAIAGAEASPVSFTAGFTSFRGPVATGAGAREAVARTQINGVNVYADEPIPGLEAAFTDLGLGLKNTTSLLDAAGDPIPVVDFSLSFYGPPSLNSVAFTPAGPLDLQVGSVFKAGTFTVTNGSWFGNSPNAGYTFPDTDFGFSVTTRSSDPALDGFTFTDTLRFVVTDPAGENPSIEDDADYFYFLNRPELGTIRVFEATDRLGNPTPGNTGSVDLMVQIGSLVPVSLDNATGGVYVGAPVPAVPEPAAWLLMMGGSAALLLWRRQRGDR